MFSNNPSFNQPIATWNTANVTNMAYMFFYATGFNQSLKRSGNAWNTASVTTMASMFSSATSFNMPLSSWDTWVVVDMSNMFMNATSFNQNLSGWSVGSVTPKPPSGFDSGATAWTLARPIWT